jgi:hypothetical protein
LVGEALASIGGTWNKSIAAEAQATQQERLSAELK